MKISTVTRLVKYTPGTGKYFANMPSPVQEMIVEKLIDGDHYWARSPYLDPSGANLEDTFDGTNCMEFDGLKHRGYIARGRSGRNVDTVNDVARCLLFNPIPEVPTIARVRWGKPFLSDQFRDFTNGGVLRSGLRVKAELEVIDGIPCYVMQLADGSATVWLAQSLGMMPMKFERKAGNEICTSIIVDKVGSVATDTGVMWYPAHATIAGGTTYVGITIYEVIVKEFVPNASFPPGAFQLQFPNGTTVYDRNRNIVYTTAAVGQDQRAPIFVLHDGNKPDIIQKPPNDANIIQRLPNASGSDLLPNI